MRAPSGSLRPVTIARCFISITFLLAVGVSTCAQQTSSAAVARPTTIERPSDSGNLMEQGPYDQRCRPELWFCEDTLPLSARNDVLVFQTEPLYKDVEVTGPLTVKLWASSNVPDKDFTAKLVDVYPPNRDFPPGLDLNVQGGIIRGRYRNSLRHPEPMKTGEIYPFTIEMAQIVPSNSSRMAEPAANTRLSTNTSVPITNLR